MSFLLKYFTKIVYFSFFLSYFRWTLWCASQKCDFFNGTRGALPQYTDTFLCLALGSSWLLYPDLPNLCRFKKNCFISMCINYLADIFFCEFPHRILSDSLAEGGLKVSVFNQKGNPAFSTFLPPSSADICEKRISNIPPFPHGLSLSIYPTNGNFLTDSCSSGLMTFTPWI